MIKTILIIDEEPDILDATIFRLKKMGYAILIAINGQDALDLLQKTPSRPDLILLDLLIPQVRG